MELKTLPTIRHEDKPRPANANSFNPFHCIDMVFYFFSKGIKIIGPAFALSVAVFVSISAYCFFFVIIPFWYKLTNLVVCIILIVTGLLILFWLLFNYTFSVLVKPGTMEDIITSKKYKQTDPLGIDNPFINFKEVLKNSINIQLNEGNRIHSDKKTGNPMMSLDNSNCIPRVIKYKEKYIEEEEKILINNKRLPECRYCRSFKPVRAHHCSVCNKCIFKMDHHCPWINNCIGQNNQRYFVLFLLFVQIGTAFVILVSLPLWIKLSIPKKSLYFYVSILNVIGFCIATFFSVWQWRIILKGRTTIEHWTITNNVNPGANVKLSDFSFKDWKDNLFLVFGTRSILKAVFVPSMRMLPYSGLEWTKVAYPNFELSDVVCYKNK